ncbi:MAG: hypothetical protein JSW50_02240 [Candidatus Latescibacterota bacterium]|nr:MAG: hypothetical protein JSW50_02240 [Candidatus Latescibacterota bacterium]
MKRIFMLGALVTFVLAIPISLLYWAPPQITKSGGNVYLTAGGSDVSIAKKKKKKTKRKAKRKKAKRKTK